MMNKTKGSTLSLLCCGVFLLAIGTRWSEEHRAPDIWMPDILSTESADYLPDFSYAGYHWSEDGLPNYKATLDVRDFGATPNDGEDDTEAIRAALQATHDEVGTVVLRFPHGRFRVSDILFIERSNLVLQGAGSGPGGTTLYMPEPLSNVGELPTKLQELKQYLVENDKRTTNDNGEEELFSPFSWTGGFLWTRLPEARDPEVLTAARGGKRGAHQFTVETPKDVQVGQTVRINWYNKDGDDSSLLHHIYQMRGLEFGARLWENPDQPLISQVVTVTERSGHTLTIKEPLLHDLRPEWHTELATTDFLREVGIEHLSVEFPETSYGGHHLEAGYNAFYLNDLRHGWLRDVHISNPDSGILSDDCSNVTIQQLTVTGRPNHYAVHLGSVQGMLVRDFRTETDSYHPISFNTKARASVFTHGQVLHPRLDQHQGLNHQNLFDDVSGIVRDTSINLFEHGGADYWGPTHGAFNTFWNVNVHFSKPDAMETPADLGTITDGGAGRIVGLTSNVPIDFSYGPDAYIEGTNREGIAVASLYEYQLRQRLASRSTIETTQTQ